MLTYEEAIERSKELEDGDETLDYRARARELAQFILEQHQKTMAIVVDIEFLDRIGALDEPAGQA